MTSRGQFLRHATAALAAMLLLAGLRAEDSYEEPPLTERDRRHWAWRPARSGLEGTVDSFLLEKLREKGIEDFAPRAGDATLLRRLHFDLLGLPPTAEEIAAFSPARLEETIDELLARPQYGERWAQHWLDVARFAETDGFEHDKVRGEAWRYRDWVVGALNRDLPYDEFLSLQLAGDEIAGTGSPDRYATGFLLAGPDMPDINLEEERRHNVLNEATGTVGAAFLGLTLSCAQCHDHKTDPVSQADFYRLRAFFENLDMPKKNQSLPPVFAERGASVESPSILRIRGDFRRAGPELAPAFLRIVNPGAAAPAPSAAGNSSGRRFALARRLGDPAHPLVARVFVNRVWQHHFGRGLVATPNDFGRTGEHPTHPELLDWLATEFVESDWSLKSLHRTILLSRAWQQASRKTGDDASWERRLEVDPDGSLLSRRIPLRLSGEAIRDAMLASSGRLNAKMGGPGVRPPLPAEVTVTLLKGQWPVTEDESEHYRRSLYLFLRRNLRYPMFDVFDKPDPNLSCGRRHPSTTAPQSLTLLNSAFSDARAADLAKSLETSPSDGERIRDAFLRTLGREPAPEESAAARSFLATSTVSEFALALYNLNEFVFID